MSQGGAYRIIVTDLDENGFAASVIVNFFIVTPIKLIFSPDAFKHHRKLCIRWMVGKNGATCESPDECKGKGWVMNVKTYSTSTSDPVLIKCKA